MPSHSPELDLETRSIQCRAYELHLWRGRRAQTPPSLPLATLPLSHQSARGPRPEFPQCHQQTRPEILETWHTSCKVRCDCTINCNNCLQRSKYFSVRITRTIFADEVSEETLIKFSKSLRAEGWTTVIFLAPWRRFSHFVHHCMSTGKNGDLAHKFCAEMWKHEYRCW